MKITLAIFAAFAIGCNSQKEAASELATADCPADGTCSIAILKNKRIVIPQNVVGSTYYQLAESTTTDVIKYKYIKSVDTTLADSGHREELVFEVSSSNPSSELTGNELQKVNMLFGRYCFCRGSTGVYPVRQGMLKVLKSGSQLHISTTFKVDEVPQIISGFSTTAK